ncbi:MAG: hypothetical protein ABF868_06565 [Sporolactobacillus sp.]
MKKVLITLIAVLALNILVFAGWEVYVAAAIPHFHEGRGNTLVSHSATLERVTNQPDQSSIVVPKHIPPWHLMGLVDGKMHGNIYYFYFKSRKYALYQTDLGMDDAISIYRLQK